VRLNGVFGEVGVGDYVEGGPEVKAKSQEAKSQSVHMERGNGLVLLFQRLPDIKYGRVQQMRRDPRQTRKPVVGLPRCLSHG